jgi:hypothetical protein
MHAKKSALRKALSRGLTFIVFGVAMTTLPITACNRATPAQEPVTTPS